MQITKSWVGTMSREIFFVPSRGSMLSVTKAVSVLVALPTVPKWVERDLPRVDYFLSCPRFGFMFLVVMDEILGNIFGWSKDVICGRISIPLHFVS